MSFKVPNEYRIKKGRMGSDDSRGNYGAFEIPFESYRFFVIAADGNETGWQHVSVSLVKGKRCPNWKEMCFIKSLFWDEEDVVIQYHPPKSQYVNNYDYCLHLWRPVKQQIPLPPLICV